MLSNSGDVILMTADDVDNCEQTHVTGWPQQN
ncbi:hypothetical protein A2U01_0119266, partial [Trifolium medium]|nr:hypothetical protein [Trifolium medium]